MEQAIKDNRIISLKEMQVRKNAAYTLLGSALMALVFYEPAR